MFREETPAYVRVPRNLALRAAKKERVRAVKEEVAAPEVVPEEAPEIDYRAKLRARFAAYYADETEPEQAKEEEEACAESAEDVNLIEEEEEEKEPVKEEKATEDVQHVEAPKPKKKVKLVEIQEIPAGDPREINPVLPEVQMHETVGQIRKKAKVRPTRRRPAPKRPPNAALDRTIFDVKERSRHVQFCIPFEDGTCLYAETSPRDDAPREGDDFNRACKIKPPMAVSEDTDEFVEVEKTMEETDDQFKPNYETICECIKNRVADLPIRRRIQKAMSSNAQDHLIVVLSEPLRTVEGVYKLADDTLEKVWGETPAQISKDDCLRFWRYVPKRDFIPQRVFTSQTDAVSIVV